MADAKTESKFSSKLSQDECFTINHSLDQANDQLRNVIYAMEQAGVDPMQIDAVRELEKKVFILAACEMRKK